MQYTRLIFLPILIVSASICFAQPKTDSLLNKILSDSPGKTLSAVIANKDSFRVQIIYTQINRDQHNKPAFKNYYFNLDTNLYFNPASTVKLPLALLSLEKLHTLPVKGVDKYSPLLIDSDYLWQTSEISDSTSQTGLPSVSQYIKKAFLVSDNDAYNRMYQFVGQQQINRALHSKQYSGTRITRQFLGLSAEQNRHTNSMRFLDHKKRVIYTQPGAFNPDSFDFGRTIKMGRAYYNAKDSLINEPIDFTRSNHLPLEDLQQILQSVLFPASVAAERRFNLSKEDYHFVYQYLSQYPSETNYPKYDSSEYYDSYVKYYFRQSGHRIPGYIRVFNKVGWAYGFLIDASYVVDFKNKIEYMITSTIYVNKDGILNDDTYEYEETGLPFMKELGDAIYQYELKRVRRYRPDLTEFHIKYEHRNPDDKRPVIRNVDN